jgi:bifunctional non-homologous end joining protein LigD
MPTNIKAAFIDGEVVALDDSGCPSFSALQNVGKSRANIVYFIFDVLVLSRRNVMAQPLSKRRELLRQEILVRLGDPIRASVELNASLPDILNAVRTQGLEGIVAKNLHSIYEPGARSGAWRKMRVNTRQEFVIGGYTLGARDFDAVVFGYYEGANLLYAARTRNGFTASSKAQIYRRFRQLESATCPFVNLPEDKAGRWGQGLTAEKMKKCRWLKPLLVGEFEFVEWTEDKHLRHSRFVALREEEGQLPGWESE